MFSHQPTFPNPPFSPTILFFTLSWLLDRLFGAFCGCFRDGRWLLVLGRRAGKRLLTFHNWNRTMSTIRMLISYDIWRTRWPWKEDLPSSASSSSLLLSQAATWILLLFLSLFEDAVSEEKSHTISTDYSGKNVKIPHHHHHHSSSLVWKTEWFYSLIMQEILEIRLTLEGRHSRVSLGTGGFCSGVPWFLIWIAAGLRFLGFLEERCERWFGLPICIDIFLFLSWCNFFADLCWFFWSYFGFLFCSFFTFLLLSCFSKHGGNPWVVSLCFGWFIEPTVSWRLMRENGSIYEIKKILNIA